jgi:predicted TIM-barrel fold metal-dependent hydrolase
MRKRRLRQALVLSTVFSASGPASAGGPPTSAPQFGRIDAHAHVFSSPPAFVDMLERLDVRLLNIAVVDKHDPGFEEAGPQHERAAEVARASRGRAPWCSTFDPQDWESAGFAGRTIARLERTFEQGAVAVKIYKSIGMELKARSGAYLMPDDPVFQPILEAIQAHDKTLFAHLAEPTAAWHPLDPSSPHYGYYKSNPDWHMFLHPERPRKETILAARDRVLKRHPRLRVVGCHLGSMEDDVHAIARRFDLHPNFAVDTAARVPDLMIQPREKVRDFLIKYQDRVLYATDLTLTPADKTAESLAHWEKTYDRDWTYFATSETVAYEGRTIRGLELPDAVLRKLFRANAEKWVPGIMKAREAP